MKSITVVARSRVCQDIEGTERSEERNHVSFDGQSQRNALTAAERAIRALGDGDADRAASNAARAANLDQTGLYAELPGAVGGAAAQIAEGGSVEAEGWDAVAKAVGAGPLGFLVAEVRND